MRHGYQNISSTRDRLVADHTNLVQKIAFYYAGRVGDAAEPEDLIQLGMIGLMEAVHNYSSQEDVPFASYASLRIKGAIVDYLRKASNLCRGTIKRKQTYDRAIRTLELRLKRPPESSEICEELKINENMLADWRQSFAASRSQSIEEAMDSFGDFLFSFDEAVEEKIYNNELKKILKDKIQYLNKQQALVLQLYYVDELNVYEIAEVLSVTTGRVSQIKSAAVSKLRDEIEATIKNN